MTNDVLQTAAVFRAHTQQRPHGAKGEQIHPQLDNDDTALSLLEALKE